MSKRKRERDINSSLQGPMFGPAPVLKGENSKAYNDLLMQVSTYVKPTNIIEDLWVGDFTNLAWELRRYRRYRDGVIEAATAEALEEMLTPFMDDPSKFGATVRYDVDGHRVPTPAAELVNGWIRQEPAALKRVEAILTSAKLTMEDVKARAFARQADKIEQIERLICNAETRRNAILREIDYHRAAPARAQRRATQEIVDGDFEPITPKAIASQTKN